MSNLLPYAYARDFGLLARAGVQNGQGGQGSQGSQFGAAGAQGRGQSGGFGGAQRMGANSGRWARHGRKIVLYGV